MTPPLCHKLKDAAIDIFGARITENEIFPYLNSIKHFNKPDVTPAFFSKCIDDVRRLNNQLFFYMKAKMRAEDKDEEKGTMIELTNHEKSIIAFLLEALEQLNRYLEKQESLALEYKMKQGKG